MTSFLQAVALVGVDDVSAKDFVPYAERIVGLLPETFAQLARDADARSHPGDEDRLVMNEAAIGHLVEASEARRVDASLVEATRILARRSIERGHGEDGFSRVIEEVRPR